jgi:hypothetical protein
VGEPLPDSTPTSILRVTSCANVSRSCAKPRPTATRPPPVAA